MMLKYALTIGLTVLFCTLDTQATLAGQIGSVRTFLTGSLIPVGILGAASIGFFASILKGNTAQAFSIVGIGILFAFFYAWVTTGFELGLSS